MNNLVRKAGNMRHKLNTYCIMTQKLGWTIKKINLKIFS